MKVWSHNYSMRHRVLASLFLATCAYWSVIAILTMKHNMEEVHELYDIHLAHTALALLRLNEPGKKAVSVQTIEGSIGVIEQLFKKWPDLPERVTRDNLAPVEKQKLTAAASRAADTSVVDKNVQHGLTLRYQLWHRDGKLLFQSANAPSTPMSKDLGFSIETDTHGRVWRNYSIWDAQGDVQAIVSEAEDDRMQLVHSIAISAMNPILLGMPVFVLLLWLSVQRGMGPLLDLSQAISRRDANSLLPFEQANSPPELQPIVLSLNNLIDRIQHSLDAERRFNANAAHELNTPLAAINAHLFVARHARGEAEREQALNQAQAATERSIRLIRQMLALARLGPLGMAQLVNVDIHEIAQETCAELAPMAWQRNQTLELQCPPGPLMLSGQADLLHQMISNLVDNAMRYSPPDSQILLNLERTEKGVRLTVNDDGPGIPEVLREKVFNRFFRLADQSVSGTGLGLAICQKIALMHHANISLSDGQRGKGLSVHVNFQLRPDV